MIRRLGSSFRDPAGFVYEREGRLFRQVHPQYQPHYETLTGSGLYDALVARGWLVRHEELDQSAPGVYRVLVPERVPFVSYPYEWCFGQLRDAALLTLDIQALSLTRGMVLKDASAFNVQFVGARPIFIDTLSFERYEEGSPWVAYRQFCEHFLGPLALMAYRDARLRRLLTGFIDGMPLDLVAGLLPRRSLARYGLLAHLHLHARSQQLATSGGGVAARRTPRLSRSRLAALVASLRATVEQLRLPARRTPWSHYYDEHSYSGASMGEKERLVRAWVDEFAAPGETVHDLGANTGRFSQLVAGAQRYVVAHDVDEAAVERHYAAARTSGAAGVLPLVLDLTNPTPALGWGVAERTSSFDRIEGMVMALALVHHLAIANNVPLPTLAETLARVARVLIIEFVPKGDSQVQRMLATRPDIFPDYTEDGFEAAFRGPFHIERRAPVVGSTRTLYAMRRRDSR